jgi:hypothetical protein
MPDAVASAPSNATAPSSTPAPSASATADTTIKLLDPGKPPHRALRYAWRADRHEQLVLDLRTSVATEVGGAKQTEIPLPPVRITLDVDPTRVAPDGALSFTWTVRSAAVTGEGASSEIAQGLRPEVAAVEHLAGHATMNARGLCTDFAIDPATVVDAGTTGEIVEQVRQTLRDVAVPWPEEPVGRGARWQRIAELAGRSSRLTQTDTYTLTQLDGATGAVDDVLAQTAPPQVLHAPGNGADPRMESMLASGTWKTRFDLSRLVPQSHFDGTTTMVVSGSSGEAARRVTMVMRMGIDVGGTVR